VDVKIKINNIVTNNILSIIVGLMPVLGKITGFKLLFDGFSLLFILYFIYNSNKIKYIFFLCLLFLSIEVIRYDSVNIIIADLWGLLVFVYFANVSKFKINYNIVFTILFSSLFISYLILIIISYFVPNYFFDRYSGLYSSVLSYGFVASNTAIITVLVGYSMRLKVLLLSLIILFSIPSGSRHGVFISIICLIYVFLKGKQYVLFLFMIIALLMLFLNPVIIGYLNDIGLRALLKNETSDSGRLVSFFHLNDMSTVYRLLFGMGRISNGSLASGLGFDINDIVIESSWLTFFYSYGILLSGFMVILLFFKIYHLHSQKHTIPFVLVCIHISQGIISQVFENPVMLLIYIVTFSLLISKENVKFYSIPLSKSHSEV
jgi:hypothetical protein